MPHEGDWPDPDKARSDDHIDSIVRQLKAPGVRVGTSKIIHGYVPPEDPDGLWVHSGQRTLVVTYWVDQD